MHLAAIAIALCVAAAPAPSGPPTATPDPAQERVQAATEASRLSLASLGAGTGTYEDCYQWSVRLLAAERDATPSRSGAALAAHADRMNELSSIVEKRVRDGMLSRNALVAARFYRAEAQVWMAQPR